MQLRSISAAMIALAAMTVHASAEAVWNGEFITTNTTTACGTAWQVGDLASAVFRPVVPGSATNGSVSRLSVLTRSSAFAVEVSGQFDGNVLYDGTVVSSAGIVSTYSAPGGIVNAAISPASFVASTKILRATGRITRFANIPNCSVTFSAVFVKRP